MIECNAKIAPSQAGRPFQPISAIFRRLPDRRILVIGKTTAIHSRYQESKVEIEPAPISTTARVEPNDDRRPVVAESITI